MPKDLYIKTKNQPIKLKMKWDIRVQHIIKKKNKYLIFIYAKIRNKMTTKTLLMVYYAFYHSLINYGTITWGAAGKTLLPLVQRIQDRIIKLINRNFLGDNYPLSITQVYKFTCLLYHYETLKEIFIKTARNTRYKTLNYRQ